MPTFVFSTDRPTDLDVDVLVLPVFEGPEAGPGVKDVKGIDLLALFRGQHHGVPHRAIHQRVRAAAIGFRDMIEADGHAVGHSAHQCAPLRPSSWASTSRLAAGRTISH